MNSTAKHIEFIKKQSINNVIEEQIASMILDGQLSPGMRINESKLAKEFGISRSPIREACRQLAGNGFVEFETGKGAYIATVDSGEALEIYTIRGALDALAAGLAGRHDPSAVQSALEGLLHKMHDLVSRREFREYFIVNLQFHRGIVKLSGNGSLAKYYEFIENKLMLFRLYNLSSIDGVEKSLQEHQAIYDALISRDSLSASERAKNHVERAKQTLQSKLEQESSSSS